MCQICDGASRDEVLFNTHGKVLRHGWSVMGVIASFRNPPWAYTIGLASNFDHPELVVVGLPLEEAHYGLNELAALVAAGQVLDPFTTVDVAGVPVRFVDVHPAHFEHGTFAHWVEYFGALGPEMPPARALQLVLPEEFRCPDCLVLDTCLAEPAPIGPHLVTRCARRTRGRAG